MSFQTTKERLGVTPQTVSPGKRLRAQDADRPPKKTKDVGGKAREPPSAPSAPPPPAKPPKVASLDGFCAKFQTLSVLEGELTPGTGFLARR